MYWIPFSYVLLVVVFSIAWMGLAFGAVLQKMGMSASRAWIPVLRWVAAAEAGRVSTVTVMIARSVSILGVAVMLIAFLLRGIQGQDVTNPVAWATLGGIALYLAGAVAGWIMWIIGAGTIGLRLNIASGFTILAALSPPLWSAIVGWSKIGTPIPTDTIGRAASAGAKRPTTVAAEPVEYSDSGFPASRDWPAPYPTARSRSAQEPSVPSALSAPMAAVVASDPAPSALPEVDPPALDGYGIEGAESAPDVAPAPVAPDHPVSPYITAAIPPIPHAVDDGVVAETSEEQTLVEPWGGEDADAQNPANLVDPVEDDTPPVTEAPAPPAPEALDPTAPAPASAASLSLLPPGWMGLDQVPQESAESTPMTNDEPARAREPEAPPGPPAISLDPTPPPTRPAPVGQWAPPEAGGSHADAPSAAESSEEREDHTVIARRRRDVWMLEVVGGDSYPLVDSEVTIGRAAAQALGGSHIGVVDATRTMSKRHAQLRLKDGEWRVSDLGSTNGTFVRAEDGHEAEVAPGTQVAVKGVLLLGDLEARIVNQGRAR